MLSSGTAWMVALSAATAVTFGPGTVAHAQVDPATALKRQLAEGRGVRFSALSVSGRGGEDLRLEFRSTGIAAFGNGAVVARDRVDRDRRDRPTSRLIRFPDRSYRREYPRNDLLPAGKSWLLAPAPSKVALECGPIELSHPPTLRALLATATVTRPAGVYDKVRTTLHQGRTTLGELYKVNPDVRISLSAEPTGKYARVPVDWQLWVGRDRLVRRCRSSFDEPIIAPGFDEGHASRQTDDVRFSRWGIKADIQPPPEDQVARYDEIDPTTMDSSHG
ncbi:hypothetical protein ACGF0J_18550 [Nonomuraea sp. NPDC047897]|uniref:hypothetical protein n=1 Tax=Nonomuraea sp. NPDC047897 TaxID=3364346 RepID=UPI003712ABCC